MIRVKKSGLKNRPLCVRARALSRTGSHAFVMAESFGAIPFSVGGTNASGYSLVAVFTLSTNTSLAFSISSTSYDFGVVMSGFYSECPYIIPIFFINSTGRTYLGHYSSTSTVSMNTVYIQVTSSQISSVHTYPGEHQESIAVFKFN